MFMDWVFGDNCLLSGVVPRNEPQPCHQSPYRFIVHAQVTSNFEQIGEERALAAFLNV